MTPNNYDNSVYFILSFWRDARISLDVIGALAIAASLQLNYELRISNYELVIGALAIAASLQLD
ncbi:hypothetical protein FNW02_23950 [Komarekiella sp. 'clone 1']|uniref:Uncharacterized protein n=1 Tax=Komarekiella delphini-convector SJRDD-AB1 TaxID=2593771 RepID=A0AA40VT30_9NOST|nr:hypothetical protein [Komarekiella delphini-convector]MBD6618794.1 hypothetical protein [Komarekiella delphini-convector SJRDD-AB1]